MKSLICGGLGAALCSFVFSGIAMAEAETTSQATVVEQAEVDRSCLRAHRIRGFNALGRKHILLTGSPRTEKYLVELSGGCFNVNHADQLAVDTVSTMSCVTRSDRVILSSYGGFDRPERCLIRTIEPVESREAARALIESRKEEAAAE